jgi:uncharacterized protein YraI
MVAMRVLALLAALVVAGCVSNSSVVYREAVTTGAVNMRAGPGTRFPVVTTIPAGAIVGVYGCVQDYSWCDTGWGNARGWVSSRYISTFYVNNVYAAYQPIFPVLFFDYGYWDIWYTGYPWYGYRRYPIYRDDWGYRGGPWRNDDIIVYPRGGGGDGFRGGGGGRRND